MKKVLFVATVPSHILRFHILYLKYFKEHGFEVHVATNAEPDLEIPFCDRTHQIPFSRSPFSTENIKAYKTLKAIINEQGFKIIHCHTPVGGVIGRLSGIGARKTGTSLIYTSHGFYFYRNGPVKYWLLFYPVEFILSFITDCLITINGEDYDRAKTFHAKSLKRVDGIGVDTEKFNIPPEASAKTKAELGLSNDDFIMTYVADLRFTKKQDFLITSLVTLKKQIPSVKLLLVGPTDTANDAYQKLVKKLMLNEYVIFTGGRNDIPEIIGLTDVYVSAGTIEGLAVNIIEAFSGGKPVVATNIRGHKDIIEHGVNGFLYELNDEAAFIEYILKLYNDEDLRRTMGENAKIKSGQFSAPLILNEMDKIYKKYM